MDIELWGPALDAEVAYRSELLAAAARRRPRAARRGDGRAPVRDAAAGTAVVRDLRTRDAAASGRRWALPGSRAWPAA